MLTKKQIKKIKWYRQSGPGIPLCIGMPFLGITKMKKSGFAFYDDLVFLLREKNEYHFYHYFNYYLALTETKKLFAKIEQDINFFKKLKKEFHKAGLEIEKLGRKMIQAKNLFKNFDQYYQPFYDQTMKFWIASLFIDLMDPFEKNILEFTFQDRLSELSKEEINLLTSPSKLSNFQKQQQLLLNAYKKAKQYGIENINDDLNDISNKFYWIKNDYAHAEYLSSNYFKKEIKKIIEDSNLAKQYENDLERFKKSLKRQKKIIINKKFNEKTVKKINFFNWITTYRDDRKKYTLICNYFLIELIKKIQIEYNVDIKLLENIFPNEMIGFVDKIRKNKLQKLEERERFGILIHALKNDAEITTGHKVNEYYKFIENTITVSEIHGATASSGKAIGHVKIILDQGEFTKMKQGDILVASMTRPDYAPIMRKAAAIVTDEGGITCHAAIVSRELGIPCVTGTQVATKTLRDGDLVDVDANHGLIKMIKNAEK